MKPWKMYLLAFAVVLVALLVPAGAHAGGWAVISLDELPQAPVAGQPLLVGFTVLQHGRTPMTGLDATITLTNPANGETIVFATQPDGGPGHYTAEVVFPGEGNWEWSIQAFTMDQAMPPLVVSLDRQAAAVEPIQSTLKLPLITGAFALVCVSAALFLLFRTRLRWGLVLLAAGLLVGGAGFAFAAGQPAASSPQNADVQAQFEAGQRLFIAKGCTTCHAHDQIPRERDAIYVDSGPNLTDFSADPEHLRRWLSDPASLRPGTEMPDLNLDQAEIEALVIFLDSE